MMPTPLLDRIQSPVDLQSFSAQEMAALATEIREYMTEVVGTTGGHLASNLGIVELTLALHRAYDFATDRLVFDVGHQCYVHKLLTGRKGRFPSLRQKDGITGFPNPRESEYDPFVVGHASTSISSALGLATAKRLLQQPGKVVAVVGDGAIGGGMCFEALNNAGHMQEDLLVILNDNDMAIAETVGAFSKYLTEVRANPTTHRIREELQTIFRQIPLIGSSLEWVQEQVLGAVKGLVDESHVFSAMGFRYFGPLDAHDMPLLEQELRNLRQQPGPKILHVVSRKGQGFPAASADPETFHSAVPFEVRGSGEVVPRHAGCESYSDHFVRQLAVRAREDKRIVAITAAMPAGTGIKTFARDFPDRFFDVGICEAHSITFAAGLARQGLRPVVAIYSTFLQRGYDQIIHDVAIQPELPIVFALDRAGLVGADGPTHHGVFDIAFLRHIPGLTLLAPRDGREITAMLDWALQQPGPVAIRYPRGGAPDLSAAIPERSPVERGVSECLCDGDAGTLFAYGRMVEIALQAAAQVQTDGGAAWRVVNARFAAPLDSNALRQAAGLGPVVTLEDHVLAGGFGSAVGEAYREMHLAPRLTCIGIPDHFVEHGRVAELDRDLGLDADSIATRLRSLVP